MATKFPVDQVFRNQLEKRMYEHARDLEFEQAARLRDEINELRGQGLGFPKRAEEEPA